MKKRFLLKLLVLISYLFILPFGIGYYNFFSGVTPSESLIFSLWFFSVFYNFLPVFLEFFILRRKSLDWFSPVLFALFQSFGSLGAVLSLIKNDWNGFWMNGEEVIFPLLIKYFMLDIFAKTIFFAAYYANMGKYLTGFLPKFKPDWNGKKVRIAVFVCIGIGMLGYMAIALQSGGVSGLLNNLAFRRSTMKGQTHFFLMALAIPVSLWCYWAYLLQRKEFKILPIVLMVFGFLLFLTLGGRGAAARILLGGIIIYHYLFRCVKFGVLLPVAFVGYTAMLILGVVRVNTYRLGYFDLSPFWDPQVYVDVYINPETGEGSQGLERTLTVLDGVPNGIPFQYFTTYKTILTTFIPRSIYPEKKGLSEAAVYAPLFGNNTEGTYGMYPAGSLGDFWLQAGVFGIFVGFFFQGLIQRTFYEYLIKYKSVPVVVLYVIVLMIGMLKLRNLGIFQTLLYLIIFFPFQWLVSSKKNYG